MSENPTKKPFMSRAMPGFTVLVCLGIAALAILLIWIIRSTEPTAQRTTATRVSPMLVEVVQPEFGTFTPVIRALGTVEAESDLTVSPRVSGQVLRVADSFREGAVVQAGEVLLEMDPADYEAQLIQRRSELHQAQADFAIEEGRRQVAEQDLQMLGREVTEESRRRILREPQRMAALARVELAEAALRRAELDLERTILRAPFDAQVIERTAAPGSQVSPGVPVGRIVGMNHYKVMVSLPLAQVDSLQLRMGAGQVGSVARMRHSSAWRPGIFRQGSVLSLVGALDERTRLARVLIEVEDPLARTSANVGQPPLILGSILEVEIEAQPLEGVARISRDHLHQNDTVWVMEGELLRIVPVEVAYRDEEYVYISEGLSPDSRVVTTNLRRVSDGAPLRLSTEPGL